MDTYEYGELLKELENKLQNITKVIQPNVLREELTNISHMELDPKFWEDSKKAGEIGKQKSKITRLLETFDTTSALLADSKELFALRI